MLPLLLASASPRRREMLERIGVPLEVRAPEIDEEPHRGETPEAYVTRLAYTKALAAIRRPGQWVLAADTTVTIDGAILGKARTREEALGMLRRLSGETHRVLTAFTVLGAHDDAPVHRDGAVMTEVAMIAMDDALITDYIASDEWRGKAGAYAIQGIGAALVREVRGSVTNVVGLPLAEVLEMLRTVGAPVGQLAAGQPA